MTSPDERGANDEQTVMSDMCDLICAMFGPP